MRAPWYGTGTVTKTVSFVRLRLRVFFVPTMVTRTNPNKQVIYSTLGMEMMFALEEYGMVVWHLGYPALERNFTNFRVKNIKFALKY